MNGDNGNNGDDGDELFKLMNVMMLDLIMKGDEEYDGDNGESDTGMW